MLPRRVVWLCAPPASPERFDYCKGLYQLYPRYHTIPTIVHDGGWARAEQALEDCRQGRYDAGEAVLKGLLAHERSTMPAYAP